MRSCAWTVIWQIHWLQQVLLCKPMTCSKSLFELFCTCHVQVCVLYYERAFELCQPAALWWMRSALLLHVLEMDCAAQLGLDQGLTTHEHANLQERPNRTSNTMLVCQTNASCAAMNFTGTGPACEGMPPASGAWGTSVAACAQHRGRCSSMWCFSACCAHWGPRVLIAK